MLWKLSKFQAVLIGLVLSIVFLHYFAHVVQEGLVLWAISALSPILKSVRANFGTTYSHPLGQGVAWFVGVACTYLFLLPLRYVLNGRTPPIAVGTLSVVPTVLLSGAQGMPSSAFQWALYGQPLVALALFAAVQLRSKPGIEEVRSA
jgi:hypothetical protein